MNNIFKRDWLIFIILIAPFLALPFFWDMLPDQIPTHFNIHGRPDQYSDKTFGLLLLPGINILVYFVFLLAPYLDPRRKNYELFEDKLKIIRLVTHLFLAYIFALIILFSLGHAFDLTMATLYGMIALFLVLGNYMGNVRPNNFIGVRTPWTLGDEEVWKLTHRFTAKLWVISSVMMMVILPFVKGQIFWIIAFTLVISIVPITYSYIVYQNLRKGKIS